jgi:hypothetical protein
LLQRASCASQSPAATVIDNPKGQPLCLACCPGGGIGRRTGFRYQRRKPWRFESSPGHQIPHSSLKSKWFLSNQELAAARVVHTLSSRGKCSGRARRAGLAVHLMALSIASPDRGDGRDALSINLLERLDPELKVLNRALDLLGGRPKRSAPEPSKLDAQLLRTADKRGRLCKRTKVHASSSQSAIHHIRTDFRLDRCCCICGNGFRGRI